MEIHILVCNATMVKSQWGGGAEKSWGREALGPRASLGLGLGDGTAGQRTVDFYIAILPPSPYVLSS